MVSLQTINVGLAPNDKKGDPLRGAMQKVNLNFTALNEAIQGVLDGKGQANGYASLGADGRLVAAQAPIVYSAVLPTAAHDLNDYGAPGSFYQTTDAGAVAGANYPTTYAGFLLVWAAGSATVLQLYCARTSNIATRGVFWRVKVGTTTWAPWKEVVDTSAAMSYVGGMAAAQDLNTYTTRGLWAIGSSATAAGGTNFPIGQSGFLLVLSSIHQGVATTGVFQTYYAANSNRVFTRALISTVWTAWTESLGANLLGAASGIAQLGTDSRLLPAQAPILYSTAIPGSTDANAMIVPGVYYVNSDAAATPELNWPERLAGQLTVEMAITGNSQVTQVYTTRNGTGGVSRTYKRVRFGTGGGTWGAWQQLARYDDAMTHVFLTAAADANTLVADNVFYTWRSGVVVAGGSNWAPVGTNISGGSLEVRVTSSDMIIQTATFLVGSNKPRIYQRFGSGSSWQAWKIISAVSSVTWLPTADAGDAYVDGLGWHAWNGTAYALTSLATTLPTTAHDLNTYQTPGQYRQASTAGATAGSNYPVAIGGLLEVTGTGTAGQTKQTYTLASSVNVGLTSGPRQFWRMAINTVWSPWQEVLTVAMGLTQQIVAAAADANTLSAVNTQYVWTNGAVVNSGTNWPALGFTAARGFLEVVAVSGTQVYQRLVLLLAAAVHPVVYERLGNVGGTWYGWRIGGPISSTSYLPTADYGDIYVDGMGTHRWNGTGYVPSSLPAGYRQGLRTSRASTTAITVQPGRCASFTGDADLVLSAASTRTIQTSGAFSAAATGNGLLTGARAANTYYHVFLLRRDSDGFVCVAFDTAVDCANRPAGYTHYRRVGSVRTDPGNTIWVYTQLDNQFWFDVNVRIYSTDILIPGSTYVPSTGTPPGVSHTLHALMWATATTGASPLVSGQRPTREGGYSELTYMTLANPTANSINRVDFAQPAVAGAGPHLRVSADQPCTLTLWVEGYTDHFED
ncbi:pyocin knob domain-containing protein [Achromobacter sp.]|uniref:pyocin knob domain-containing protein n=1 Tax=Achromobacter sp. TaxID=134375 RepID=UPI000EF08160|nr:pyocin knob domain-containing protein [Achromobacter sp.]HCW18355.1 hypothetical protein [Achromobacter sp.]